MESDSLDLLKKRLRRMADSARGALSERERLDKSRCIAETLFADVGWQNAHVVCVYVWFKNEVQTDAVLDRAWQEGKTVVVPFCCNDQPEKIRLYRLDSRNQLAPGTFGILEPSESCRLQPKSRIEEENVDLYVIPGVAFDRQNNRLGWGGGYYDRLLSRSPNAIKIALAFDCQILESVPVGPLDIPMDRMITEKGCL